ncbi:MAG: hypothetical protein ACPGTQ_02205 [Colwellia sp.]
MADDYLKEFLGEDSPLNKPVEDKNRPSWAVEGETSGKAYDAINKFKTAKLRYINTHSDEKDFKNKFSYKISKTEVAKEIGKNPQPIFNDVSYSVKLSEYYDDVNDKLEEKKELKINKPKHGLQHLSKDEIKKKAQKQEKDLVKLQKNNCEELYARLLSNMPLDIKKNLGLK